MQTQLITYLRAGYGRRGNALTNGVKTENPLPLETATKVFEKLIASKIAKGYQHSDQPTPAYSQSGNEGKDTGFRCQLLNPVEESRLRELLDCKCHCLQEKFDGRRMLIRKLGDEITGINRRGFVIAIPDVIRDMIASIPFSFLMDGEAVGERYHPFDVLEIGNEDLRPRRYIDRFIRMSTLIPKKQRVLVPASTYTPPEEKARVFAEIKAAGKEGVVFKDMDAPFDPGRPNSGGSQLKFKFVESASFIVTARNNKRSVSLGLYRGTKLVAAGNVTIPPNHEIPSVGDIVECSYLYAFKQSGSIYQPVYLGKRDDIPPGECVVDQLKYKPESAAA